ncbi:MAG TPA: 5-(carboxyamino)imidazole ribonucleotide synthase [Candidatus Cybelea sp.]|nr:5-(carboxyamino)imidazole ribonucleotide synthase [Candidatus Cybelea sp.]
MSPAQWIPPGSTIGILGGGQLGRMIALAAAELGYRCHIFCPDTDSPALHVAAAATVAGYDDTHALERFAGAIDVATFEFENVPAAAVELLARRVPVRPDASVLAVTQDRLTEKDFVIGLGARTAPYAAISRVGDIAAAIAKVPGRAVLKTRRMGYDGKGQRIVEGGEAAVAAAFAELGAAECILEGFVDFACEISVLVARGLDGRDAAYVPVENRHTRHILDCTIAPARIAPEVARDAVSMARRITRDLGLVGVLAVEMFVRRDGAVLVNELAPRVHNSGHWTIEACATSQFEQLVRAVCGLPLGSPERHSNAIMRNLIGEDVARWAEIVADPANKLHLYGKAEARPGRKMGHVTRLYPLDVAPDV